MTVNDLRRRDDTRYAAVNLCHTPSFGGVASQSMSHAMAAAELDIGLLVRPFDYRKIRRDGRLLDQVAEACGPECLATRVGFVPD